MKDCTDFAKKNKINMGSSELGLIFHHRNKTFCWKKNVDNKEKIDQLQ